MNKPQVKVTPEGLEKLKAEMAELTERRPLVVERMAQAREQGDLSENAGFHAAKDEVAAIDGRLAELRLLVRFAHVIDNNRTDVIGFGTKVIIDNGSGETEYMLVGETEADPTKGKISDKSPIGIALIGKKAGDKLSIITPDGEVQYTIKEIKS